MKAKVHDLLRPGEMGTRVRVLERLNALLAGWSASFDYGTLTPAYRAVDGHVCERVQSFLARRHKLRRRGYAKFP